MSEPRDQPQYSSFSLADAEDLIFNREIKTRLPLLVWFTKVAPDFTSNPDVLNGEEPECSKLMRIEFLQARNIFPALSPKPISKIWGITP